ncbi:MAG: cardiolipin synthase [Candidatus Cloacimonadales bacterium]|nr:cardiolipin synthase [Candidatus Cloacimonadales bacterium]
MLEVLSSFWFVLVIVFQVLGIIASLNAIWRGRTAQGSIAWSISLLTIPYIALPLYLIFGDRKFHGYVNARRTGDLKLNHLAETLFEKLVEKKLIYKNESSYYKVLENLSKMPFTLGNDAKLLINGEATFEAIFAGMAEAKDYILIQFYMVMDDNLGRRLKELIIRKVYEGVRIFFLYDEIGCHLLPKSYIHDLREKGVKIFSFRTRKRFSYQLRLNFRNHRKIVVVDGKKAYVGGHNVADKYMGINPRYGFWRDTHVQIEGPAVQCIQLPFISDWFWATNSIPDLNWEPQPSNAGQKKVLTIASGPADDQETCGIFFVHSINSAKRRLWIISPYFVPDQQVLMALQLAGMRGVDVRLMIPQKSDLLLTYLSSFSFLEEITKAGVKVYRYHKGFLHQKAMLIDEDQAVIGTANLDNRSFSINFEINILFADKDFAVLVEEMMQEDLENSYLVGAGDYKKRPFWFKLAVKVSRLLAPIQ